jgi:hypothetical protein
VGVKCVQSKVPEFESNSFRIGAVVSVKTVTCAFASRASSSVTDGKLLKFYFFTEHLLKD